MVKLINIIKIGYLTQKPFVQVRYRVKILKFLNFLLKHGIIKKYFVKNKKIFIWLRYLKNQPLIQNFMFISKKGCRKYITYKELKKLYNNSGTNILILSTSLGYLTSDEALALKCGGELLYKIIY